MELTSVAVYRRTVRASLERIWENVLDWEHLPSLHRETFARIHLLNRRPDGWQAESALRSAPHDGFVIEVQLDRPALLYHARTLEGPGTGTDIVTRLEPAGPHATRIAVEFLVPSADAPQAAAVGAAYVRLYERLWDQDEAMMRRRQAVLDGASRRETSAGGSAIDLGAESALRARLPLLLEADGQSWRVLEVDGELIAHGTVCPHWGGPLGDAVVANGCITCPWHGYRFDVRTGGSADGRGLRLLSGARVVRQPDGRCALVRAS